MKVFIGGSKTIGKLSENAAETIAGVCGNGHEILVGDCYGADLAVQRFLEKRRYENVTVFTACPKARNNIGGWPERRIVTEQAGFPAHRAKDKVMIEECDFAVMIWDGRTKGTGLNIDELNRNGKRVILLCENTLIG